MIAVHHLHCVGVVRGDGASDYYKRWVVIKWKEGKNRKILRERCIEKKVKEN